MLCTRCGKRPAVVFVTNNNSKDAPTVGYCLSCAKELGIKPVEDLISKMGISDEDLENVQDQMNSLMQGGDLSQLMEQLGADNLAEQMDDEYSVCVALLHDVVEDSGFTLNDLVEAGFPDEVTEAIGLMTHDKSVPYMDYVAAIKNNPIAREVKLAALRHNSDLSRLDTIDDKALERVEKHTKAIRLLERM